MTSWVRHWWAEVRHVAPHAARKIIFYAACAAQANT